MGFLIVRITILCVHKYVFDIYRSTRLRMMTVNDSVSAVFAEKKDHP